MPLSADLSERVASPALSHCRDGYVLVVEDEESLAELLGHLLRRLGVQVLTAGDGKNALSLFEQHREVIVLAFVDCNLPDIPGAKLCEKMRLLSPDLPLLLTSGRNQDALEEALKAGGPCEFLAKPYLPNEVLRRVTALLAAIE
jgi:two-component system cell cycle sensor histidine kinase/response regulator CckA